MCGRFFQDLLEAEVRAYFGAETTHAMSALSAEPRYNVSPGEPIWTVRLDPEGKRSLDALHWGLIPHFAKDRKGAYRCINARAETISTSPAYRAAFQRRRCLVVAHGFYEWRSAGKLKQPYAVARVDGAPMALAGVWENWLDPGTGEWLRTVSIITTEASEALRGLHDRMPVIVAPEHFAPWLGEQRVDSDSLKLLLVPAQDALRLWPVSPRMNRAGVEDPELLEPVEPSVPLEA